MDMLDPLETSNEGEIGNEMETKVVLSQELSIVDEQGMESDDEQRVVDHLSPQTLLETPAESTLQYSFRSNEGNTITYRVLHVDESLENGTQIISTGTSFQNANVQPVLTSNLNGQLYVIGSTSDVFNSQSGTRAIAPRASLIDTTSAVSANVKKKDERRRATHNEVERRRRDKINNWITKLSKIIPEGSSTEMKGNGHYEGQSKGSILAKACEFIQKLKEDNGKLEVCLKENKTLAQNLEIVQQKNTALEQENSTLREMLKCNGIAVPKECDHSKNSNSL